MKNLDTYFSPAKNSLTFIRLCLAIMVVLSHSYDLSGFGDDPLKQYCGVTIGEVAVNGFFAISGYLITNSYIRSSSTISYVWKGFIRIFPGYWACLFITAFLLAPMLYYLKYDANAIETNLLDNPFMTYVRGNFLLKINQQNISTIFFENPAKGVFNGSLWTLFPEFLCYGLVVFLGKMGCFKGRSRMFVPLVFCFCLLCHCISPNLLLMFRGTGIYGKIWYFLRLNTLLTYFLAGASLFLFSKRVPADRNLTKGAIAILFLLFISKTYIFFGALLLPYVLLCLSIDLPFSDFHKLGDYSYGIYLYSYPIQQTLFDLNVGRAVPYISFVTAMVFTFPLAWLSWNMVESYCLKLKTLKS